MGAGMTHDRTKEMDVNHVYYTLSYLIYKIGEYERAGKRRKARPLYDAVRTLELEFPDAKTLIDVMYLGAGKDITPAPSPRVLSDPHRGIAPLLIPPETWGRG